MEERKIYETRYSCKCNKNRTKYCPKCGVDFKEFNEFVRYDFEPKNDQIVIGKEKFSAAMNNGQFCFFLNDQNITHEEMYRIENAVESIGLNVGRFCLVRDEDPY